LEKTEHLGRVARLRAMISPAGTQSMQFSAVHARLAQLVAGTLGGRYPAGLGIDLDARDAEIERWFVAATLFGTRISARSQGARSGYSPVPVWCGSRARQSAIARAP
jgi:hypothetical protein